MTGKFTQDRFRSGEVAKVRVSYGFHFITAWDGDTRLFDVVTVNTNGHFCWRDWQDRVWVKDRMRSAGRSNIEWSSDVNGRSPREFWPNRVDYRPPGERP